MEFKPEKIDFIVTSPDIREHCLHGHVTEVAVTKTVQAILDGLQSKNALVVYEPDSIKPAQRNHIGDLARTTKLWVDTRRRIHKELSHSVATILVDQSILPVHIYRLRTDRGWEPIKGMSQILLEETAARGPEVLPKWMVKTHNTYKDKNTDKNNYINAPFVLHVGRGNLCSPFLAEEHVYTTPEGAVSIAAERTTRNLSQLTLSREKALRAVWQAMQGCLVLHKNGLVHQDISPGNIFLEKDSEGNEKGQLFDFEMTRPNTEVECSRSTFSYTDYTQGPREQGYMEARDTFGFGMILGDVATRNVGWAQLGLIAKYRDQETLEAYISRTISDKKIRDLIHSMTRPKRSDRIPLKDAIDEMGSIHEMASAYEIPPYLSDRKP